MIVTRGLGSSLLLTRGYGVSGILRIHGFIRIVMLTAAEYLAQTLRGCELFPCFLGAADYIGQTLRPYEYLRQYLSAQETLKTKDRFEDSI